MSFAFVCAYEALSSTCIFRETAVHARASAAPAYTRGRLVLRPPPPSASATLAVKVLCPLTGALAHLASGQESPKVHSVHMYKVYKLCFTTRFLAPGCTLATVRKFESPRREPLTASQSFAAFVEFGGNRWGCFPVGGAHLAVMLTSQKSIFDYHC